MTVRLIPIRALRRHAVATLAAVSIALTPLDMAFAHGSDASAASSALSLLPVAVSVAAPVAVFSAGAVLTLCAVEASAAGTVWVLERASDGARATLHLSGQTAGALSVGVGTAVLVTAISTGWLLSAAGHAIAFIPNQIGSALLHNERLTR